MLDGVDDAVIGLAVAVGLGLLVGLQREWVAKPIGLRSFALVSTIGGVVGILAGIHGPWILGAGLLSITMAVYVHDYLLPAAERGPGMTTELASIAVFLIGALATSGHVMTAVVLGGGVTLLLHWKRPMHDWVDRIGDVEFQAIARFVLITLVVLPILPNRSFGPYDVLNPWQTWLMVVLIVSINLAAFISLKIYSGRGGAVVSGVLGGLVSSTATTVSFATRSRAEPAVVPLATVVVLIASALVYVRVAIETAVVASSLLPTLLGPVAVFLVAFALVAGVQLFRMRPTAPSEIDVGNPAQLKTAVGFGLLYSAVLFVSAAVTEHSGELMLYPVAAISGLTDVDAITLSVGRLFVENRVDADTAWRVVFLASLSNLLFKAGIVAVVGGSALRRRLLPAMAALLLVGIALMAAWP